MAAPHMGTTYVGQPLGALSSLQLAANKEAGT
jgi:hypothetical protein